MNRTIILVTVTAAIGTAALAQAPERSLLDTSKFWTVGGSEQTSKTIKNPSVPGGRAVQVTSTGANSKYSAHISYRLVQGFKQGETITLSGVARAEKPTTVTAYVELAEAPYTRIGSGPIGLTAEWKPYSVQFIAPSDQAGGVNRAVVHLNSEARTVFFGPLAVTARAN